MITQKIEKELMARSPNLRREIKEIRSNNNESVVIFHNGSTITAVVSGESSRGMRATAIIIDEFRLVSKEVIDRIIKPFLNVQRIPPFMNKEEYKDYPLEENTEVYLSSSWYKSNYAWDMFNEYLGNSLKNNSKYCVFNFNYRLAVEHRLLSKERAEAMREEMDSISWDLEMESLFYGENESAFFKSDIINPCRTLVKPWNPPTDLEWLEAKSKNKKLDTLSKHNGEIRAISCDIALMKGNKNDASVFTLARFIPSTDGYTRKVVHIENHIGLSSEKQALRIKQLFSDFNADYIILDSNGIGLSVFEELVKPTYCEERDIEYPPYTSYNDENMADRCAIKGALPVVYTLKVVQASLNHEIAIALKDAFEKKKIELLINDSKGRDLLVEHDNLLKLSSHDQARLLAPYYTTTAMINEIINLEYQINNGFIKIVEKSGARKDMYCSLAYLNYLAKMLEKELLRPKKNKRKGLAIFW